MNYLFGIRGRIGRLQWWGGQGIILALVAIPFFAFMSNLPDYDPATIEAFMAQNAGSILLIMLAIYALCIWINVAVTVKRYHDRDKSGFWFLIVFVPLIGGIWQLVECGFLSGTDGVNSYGHRGGGGNAFGDYLDDGSADESAAVTAIRRSRGERPEKTAPVAVAPRVSRPVHGGFGKPAAATFGRRTR
jgi:uncharacterized membrane protein YhaH (DUF805 family)